MDIIQNEYSFREANDIFNTIMTGARNTSNKSTGRSSARRSVQDTVKLRPANAQPTPPVDGVQWYLESVLELNPSGVKPIMNLYLILYDSEYRISEENPDLYHKMKSAMEEGDVGVFLSEFRRARAIFCMVHGQDAAKLLTHSIPSNNCNSICTRMLVLLKRSLLPEATSPRERKAAMQFFLTSCDLASAPRVPCEGIPQSKMLAGMRALIEWILYTETISSRERRVLMHIFLETYDAMSKVSENTPNVYHKIESAAKEGDVDAFVAGLQRTISNPTQD